MAEISLARELVACPRHEQEGCPRCDGSGFRPLKRCTGCGEPAGSISEGTGALLVRSREDGEHYHVNCLPGFRRRDFGDGREDGDVMSGPAYEERECWRCDRGRIYRLSSVLEGTQSERWVPCPSCDGTQRVVVFVYAKRNRRRR